MYKLQIIAPLQCALIFQHTLLPKKFVLMSSRTHGLKLLTWTSFCALLELKNRTVSALNYVILWSTSALQIKSPESLPSAFELIWDYFCWYISVVLLLETKTQDVSGSEFTKIFLDLMHATTCSHLINSSAIPSSKNMRSQEYGLTLPFPQ